MELASYIPTITKLCVIYIQVGRKLIPMHRTPPTEASARVAAEAALAESPVAAAAAAVTEAAAALAAALPASTASPTSASKAAARVTSAMAPVVAVVQDAFAAAYQQFVKALSLLSRLHYCMKACNTRSC